MGTVATHLYEIRHFKSKKLTRTFIERYNATQKLGKQLRSGHKKLLEYLLFLYANAIFKEQAFGEGLKPGHALPPLRTNNSQLAGEMGCSRRTIINHMNRIVESGAVTEKVFHGSNAQYEVHFSPLLIHIQTKQSPDNLIHYFDKNFIRQVPIMTQGSGAPASGFFSDPVKTFHHTVSRTEQDTIKLNKLSGDVFRQIPGSQNHIPATPVEDDGKVVENPPNDCRKPSTGSTPVTPQDTEAAPGSAQGTEPVTPAGYETTMAKAGTAPRVAPVPPKEAPICIDDVLRHLPRIVAHKIKMQVRVIFVAAWMELYPGQWFTESEKERTKAVLAEYFAYSVPSRIKAGGNEVMERIILVKRWLERQRAKGKPAFLKLPSCYFDIRNPNGFRYTKSWYKPHMAKKREFKGKELLTKAVNEYTRSMDPQAPYGPGEAYRRISQRLGKFNKALLNEFHSRINSIKHGQDIH